MRYQTIRVGHSPDSDDAFMFYALAANKIDTGRYRFEHELVDIETLNCRAFHGELELTAVSLHAFAYLNDVYTLCNCGASMGDMYGPRLVENGRWTEKWTANMTEKLQTSTDTVTWNIATPGKLTTAMLTLRLFLQKQGIGTDKVQFVHVPFDRIPEAVAARQYQGEPIDAGVLIHEGQLTFAKMGLTLVQDLGVWWHGETGLPLPLGANVIRNDLGGKTQQDIVRLLYQSIQYGLEHRDEALTYALQFSRGLSKKDADEFVGMYVNHWTLDFGDVGRKAVTELLRRAFEAKVVPKRVVPDFLMPGS